MNGLGPVDDDEASASADPDVADDDDSGSIDFDNTDGGGLELEFDAAMHKNTRIAQNSEE